MTPLAPQAQNQAATLGHATQQAGFVRTAAVLGGFTLFSRLLGLARDMAMAWLLGGGPAADALVAAMRLPHVLRRLLGEGSLSMTLTASLVRLERSGAWFSLDAPLFSALNKRLALVLGLLTLTALVAAPWLARALAPGFAGPLAAETVFLLRLCLPYSLAAGMAALGMAFLHSRGLFWLPALSPALFNVCMLACAALAALSAWPPAPMLALGMLAGGLAQWLVQWLAVRRLLRPISGEAPASPDKKPAVQAPAVARAAWQCLGRLPAGLLGAAAPQLAMLAAMSVASGLGQGQVAALYYAERLLELPLGLVGACLGMASLPVLSRLAAGGQWEQFSLQTSTALRYALMFSLPAAAGLWAVGPGLVEGLLRHGAFDQEAAQNTSLALWAYLPGLPAFALNRIWLAGCNALGEARRTAMSALWAVVGTLAVGAGLGHSLVLGATAPWAAAIPALAVSFGLCLQSWLLHRVLAQALARVGAAAPRLPLAVLWRQVAAALGAGGAAWGTLALAAPFWSLWPGLVAAMVCGVLAWGLCLALCGGGEGLFRLLTNSALRRVYCYTKGGR